MFIHNYLYRLKCIVRDKQIMFWTLLFPIVLAILFNLALRNIHSTENFTEIKVGIVDDDEYRKNTAFINVIEAVSSSDNSTGTKNLFHVIYTSMEEADKLLEDNKIKGYIYFEDEIKLVVKKSGIDQSIIKGFIDDFVQTSSTVLTIINKDPDAINDGLLNNVADRTDYLKEITVSKSAPNTFVNYFYTLIAMACLYGGFWGLKEVTAIQADLSPQGARVSVAPTHKVKLFLASMLAATTVQLGVIAVLLGYLTIILKIDFGNQLGYIALTCIIGTFTGVTFGTCITTVVKKSEGLRIGILIGLSMIMSFLSGMMYDKMKYIVSTKVPILGYINPANLITDSFYSLYYYDTHTRYFKDIALLCIIAGIFSLITYLVIRRQKYASL
ncbi:antibiotic transport system permease protein [Proteiniborus sp. DW1]|uniref:ABC transporter permease n=1 Tax=Proteiniborus sp. DW1 TaxID=1889883 RepID=UPI00092DFA68|nr:ABC transporter permease [Proteiniborus sp. DW1]SCG82186.1 antibiotic transport system permease protein [Proteiniborus sp. DW1]